MEQEPIDAPAVQKAARLVCWAMLFYAIDVHFRKLDFAPDLIGAILFLRAVTVFPWRTAEGTTVNVTALVTVLGALGLLLGFLALLPVADELRATELLLAIGHTILMLTIGAAFGKAATTREAGAWRLAGWVWLACEVGIVVCHERVFSVLAPFREVEMSLLSLARYALVVRAYLISRQWARLHAVACERCGRRLGRPLEACAACMLCRKCGYSLQGLAAEACPECGWAFVRPSEATS